MLLFLANGEIFAKGAVGYEYTPATLTDTTNRIILEVVIQGVSTRAVIDTGAPYVICSPQIGRLVGVTSEAALARENMVIRGKILSGFVVRLNIQIVADVGENLDVDSTVFVPDSVELWGNFPCFIGLGGFLERIKFAIDPNTDTFYFGKL